MESVVHFYPEIDGTIGQGPTNNFVFPNGAAFAEFVTSKAYEKAPHAKIGQGGYSTVYRLHFDTQDFVLKVAEESVPELHKEINTLIKVKNKWFAVQLLAASVYPEGRAYILYPYVEGKTFSLFQRYTKKDETGIRLYRSIYNDLIDAVYELHQMGIIHHDIKPQNIWVPDVGRPFLLDFGLSETHGTEKKMIGTPAYTNFKRCFAIT
jgi:serine/threonine protein kinase